MSIVREPQNSEFIMPNGDLRYMADYFGLKTISEYKVATHEGRGFGFDFNNSGTPLAGTGSAPANVLYFIGIVGANEIHFEKISGEFQKGNVSIELFESPTYTGGTPETQYALNRATSITPTFSLLSAPTVTNDGTRIGGGFSPLTGVGSNIQSISRGIAGGRVLKTGTEYLIKIINLDTAAVTFGIDFTWYEADYNL